MSGLPRLQQGMADRGVDALLLGGDGAMVFAGGHRRIGVHMPGWPIPMAVVTRESLPHVVTADPDGATNLPEDHVHPLAWNPNTVASRLPRWLGGAASGVIGVDVLSPGGLQLIESTLPNATIIDAAALLAEVRFVKEEDEVALLRKASDIAMRAASAGLSGGVGAAYEALAGHFPASPPQVYGGAARATVLLDSFVGEARIGPGDPALLERAMRTLRPGAAADTVATELPAGVEVVGLGRGYEHPVIRDGWASPTGFQLRSGGVVLVSSGKAAVTVRLTDGDHEVLSPSPQEVCR